MIVNVAILASGNGSNAESIIRYFKNNEQIKICMVISNKEHSGVLKRAEGLGITNMFVPRETLMDGDKLLDLLHHYNIHFIVLAGYLLLVPSVVSREYNDRIVNIHPSLLPKYGGKGMYGMKVHEAVLQNKEAESGITIHYINEEFDKGEIIFQATTPIYADDTPDAIAERIHKLEHKYYPQVIEHTIINSEGSFD